MTRHFGGEWSLVAAACLIAAASACGSGDDDDGSNTEEPCFDNAGSDSSDCPASSSGKRKPASSGSTAGTSPSKPASNGPLDSGTAVEDDDDGGREPEPSGGGSVDGGSTPTSSDPSSQDEWVNAVAMLVEMADRTGCDPLARDSKLDMAAQQIANDRDAMPDVGAKYHWDGATTDKLDTALEILRTRIAANAYVCTWHRYGIGIAGDPGGTRRIVLMLAE